MKIKLLVLLLISCTAQMFAVENVTIDGITYRLNYEGNSQLDWNPYSVENWAVIQKFDESLTEVSIPKSITYNGTEYTVTCFNAYVRTDQLKLRSITFQDGVDIYIFEVLLLVIPTTPY